LSELLEWSRERTRDAGGQPELDELMRPYEHRLPRESQALREHILLYSLP
jgi:hypothetical protein